MLRLVRLNWVFGFGLRDFEVWGFRVEGFGLGYGIRGLGVQVPEPSTLEPEEEQC